MPAKVKPPSLDGGAVRAEYGCIVSFENADGKTLVLHRVGPPTRTVPEMCDQALSLDPTFMVVSYSTSATVYTDLQGERSQEGRLGDVGGSKRGQLPETQILGRIKRMDLIHPRMRRGVKHR